MDQPAQFEHFRAAVVRSATAASGTDQDVFEHRHAAKGARNLVGACDPQSAAAVGAKPGDVGAAEAHGAGGWSQRPGKDIEEGGLAGSVWADDAYRLAGPQREIDGVKDDQRTEALAYADCFQ
jgi:hypothetical protein